MKDDRDPILEELKRIAARDGGVLKPAAVVEAARPIDSVLHSRFQWDDTKAADEYRLWQARQLIRVAVQLLPGSGNQETIRVFVSLKDDREQDGGGYRPLVSVLSDKQMREQLLAEALEELEYFQEKYRKLEELSEVFRAIRKTKAKR